MTVSPNWSRRVKTLASGSTLELLAWIRDTGAQLNAEQYVSKFSGANPNGSVLGAPGDITVNVSLTSGSAGDLWTKQGTTADKSNWTRLVSSAAGGSGAPTNSAYVIVGKDATLTSARSLRAGTNITLSDGGAGSVLTISATASSATSVTVTSRLSATAGSSNITLDLPGVGTAGNYAYVTTDAYGRVTAGSTSLSTTSITGSFTTNQIVGSWTTNSIVGSWLTTQIVGYSSGTSITKTSNLSFTVGSSNVTLDLAAKGTAGSYAYVTTDAWGQVTAGSASLSTTSLSGSITTGMIVGAWTSDVSSSNISVNDLNIADGTALAPSFGYKSEESLGLYRSANSVMALSYGTLAIPSLSILSVGGFSWFGGQMYIGANPGVLTRPPVNACFVNSNITNTTTGDATGAMFGYDVEPMFASTATATSASFYVQSHTTSSGITLWDLCGLQIDSLNVGAGSSVSTYYGVKINNQTHAATNYAIFTGTGKNWFGDQVWCTSGISVGSSSNTGSLIPAISSISSKVAAFVVQGSASSFTIILWPAAKVGDVILTTVYQGTARSSMSSGLIAHSHCTQAGQIEFRLSNVSTLVQNQSAQSWAFTRITPF